MVGPHQLVVWFFGTCHQAVVLLKKLLVALLDVLDEAVLCRHPVVILLQAYALVGTSRRDLLKHGAHMLGVACHKRPTHVVSRTLEVAHGGQALTSRCVALILDGEQGNGIADEAQQVALTELREGLVDTPL
jgi:hypothetical protein